MRIHKNLFFLMQVLVVIIVVSAFSIFIWWLFEKESNIGDAQLRGHLLRMQASSEIYQGRMGSFDGVCSDIGITANFNCDESTNAFAVEARLPMGGYLCMDSVGFFGEIRQSKREAVSCTGVR